MGLKTTNLTESNLFKELEALVVHNKLMTPQAKGMAGIILYKLQNEMPINEKEEKFYNELLLFMNVPAN